MLKIKKLYGFMLQGFLPLFMMTFCICLFIVLMQFLWRFIDDLVGKGLEISVIAELFFYAALTMVPLALPLSILLASLMLFGNLGERFELTAMKSSGVSLLKAMRPLMVLIALVAVGAFFFQNDVLPKAQVKMWTLVFSVRQKSPELDIPEGVFYDQIDGYSVFVKQKNRENGRLYDLMIYDVSQGFNNSRIILSDSGKLSFTRDKRHLFLKLWKGEQFENLSDQQVSSVGAPYRRESFSDKEIMIPFDANFTRMNDSTMRKQYVGKNIAELRQTIDSVKVRIDSVGNIFGRDLQEVQYVGVDNFIRKSDGHGGILKQPAQEVKLTKPMDVDAVFNGKTLADKQRYIAFAIDRARQMKNEFEFKSYTLAEDKKVIRRHQIEMHKKFTLSIACLIFFFIGAPLGAIIRKGGIGVPIVISVLLFVFYYIIDTFGYKLARDGRVDVWEGIWASTAVLFPLGVFLTYKAVNDSAVFNAEAYVAFFRRLVGKTELRRVEMKELSMEDVVADRACVALSELKADADAFYHRNRARQNYFAYWTRGMSRKSLTQLSDKLEDVVGYLSNSRNQLVINKLMDFPVIKYNRLVQPSVYGKTARAVMIVVPVGFLVYIIGVKQHQRLRRDVKKISQVCDELTQIIKDNNQGDER